MWVLAVECPMEMARMGKSRTEYRVEMLQMEKNQREHQVENLRR